jgi:hypothetical protein
MRRVFHAGGPDASVLKPTPPGVDPEKMRIPLLVLTLAIALVALTTCGGGSSSTSGPVSASRSAARLRFDREAKALGRRINASPVAVALAGKQFEWHRSEPTAKLEAILREYLGKGGRYLRYLRSLTVSQCVRPFLSRITAIVAEGQRLVRSSLRVARAGGGAPAEAAMDRANAIIQQRARSTRRWDRRYLRGGAVDRC